MPAGFVSGPSRLNAVRTPISLRVGPAWRIAGWKFGANRNAKPSSRRAAAADARVVVDADAERVEHVGRAGLRGDGPVAVLGDGHAGRRDDERGGGRDVERAAAVAAGADDVDRSPSGASTRTTRSRMAVANPASSSTVSPRIRRPISSAASWAGVASPSMTAPIARRASSRVSVPPSTMVARAARTCSLMAPSARRRPAVANEPRRGVEQRGLPFPGLAQEVREQVRALRGEHALGVELDALDRQRDVADAHDHPVDLAHRGHAQLRRQRRRVDRERVVAGGHERRRHALEQARAVVGHLRRLAVDEGRGADDRRAERRRHRLHARGTRRAAGSRARPRP